MKETYDFIVVGGGASGCVIASRLASSPARPSVLLLEAGGTNEAMDGMSGAERFQAAFQPGSKWNWAYKTVPQYGREVDYSRGKGLGGSTAINFCGWITGADEDYNEWGRRVADDSFAWSHVQKCLCRVVTLHPEISAPFDHHVQPDPTHHGKDGPIDLTYGSEWLPSTQDVFEAARQTGFDMNPDTNSGMPIGMGIGTVCIHHGKRITAASAYLSQPPNNLTIRVDSLVSRILFEDMVAVGLETVDGVHFIVREEIILSGGAINSPQLLMLSGIGPGDALNRLGIETVLDLPQVGRNLQDHCFSSAGVVLKQKYPPSGHAQSPTPMGWFKLDGVERSEELKSLSDDMQSHLAQPHIPHWELATNTPFFDHEAIADDEEVFSAIALVMNPQSRGTIELVSTDARHAPRIDPMFLSHPYDRRVMVEAMREMLRYFRASVFQTRTVRELAWPEGNDDEAILEQCKTQLGSSWHPSGTVTMGRDASTACVDSHFKVFGVQKLRVADMSVCPLIPNNHTQSTAYVIGELAAEKLICEYRLEEEETKSA